MKLADASVDQVRTLVMTGVGVFVLYAGLKSPVSPTDITVACSLLGLEPAIRSKPHGETEASA